MKKARSLFFYLLLIGTLHNIGYIFSEDVEKPEWFQKLEELKENAENTKSKRWIKMFSILPQDLQKKIKNKLYEPLNGFKLTIHNTCNTKKGPSSLKIPAQLLSGSSSGTISIPNPFRLIDSIVDLLFPDAEQYATKQENPNFASLALQVSQSYDESLRKYLKMAWINLLKDLQNNHDFEGKAFCILLRELGDIINLRYYPGFHTTKCVEATTFAD